VRVLWWFVPAASRWARLAGFGFDDRGSRRWTPLAGFEAVRRRREIDFALPGETELGSAEEHPNKG